MVSAMQSINWNSFKQLWQLIALRSDGRLICLPAFLIAEIPGRLRASFPVSVPGGSGAHSGLDAFWFRGVREGDGPLPSRVFL